MSFKWIDYGRYIIAGSDLYRQSNYFEAKEAIAKAVNIDGDDFVANFWRLRIAVRLREFMEAESAAQQCLKIAPDLAEHLVNPWQEAIKNLQEEAEINWDDFEQETDKWLEHYQWHREFSLWNIIGIAVLSLLAPFIHVHLSVLIVVVYYYRKPRLVPNLWIAVGRSIRIFKALFLYKNFSPLFAFCFIILIGPLFLVMMQGRHLPSRQLLTDNLLTELTFFWIVAPIAEEMFFRGMLFSFLRKHIAFWAYPVVSLLFYFFHGERAAEYHFFVSLFFCWTYVKYGGLIAPIMCHILLNTPRILSILYEWIFLKN